MVGGLFLFSNIIMRNIGVRSRTTSKRHSSGGLHHTSFWPADALLFSPTAPPEHFLPHSVTAGMKRGNNPNWQDKLLGGAILTGFVVVAVIAVVFTVVTWTSGRHTASSTTAVHPLMRPDRRLIL